MKVNKKFNKLWKEYCESLNVNKVELDINSWKPSSEHSESGTSKSFFEFLELRGQLNLDTQSKE